MFLIYRTVGEKMLKKKTLLIFAASIGIVALYAAGLKALEKEDDDAEPTITMDQDLVTISVKDFSSALLKGVVAYDQEDGDLTNEVIVDSVSTFDALQQRVVTYAVFDSQNHVTKATRMMTYKDYTEPRFYFNGPMMGASISISNIIKALGATSSVDGDISQRVYLQTSYHSDYQAIDAKATVSDSTGTTSELEFTYYIDTHDYSIDLILKQYLIYVQKGDDFDPMANLEQAIINQKEEPGLINEVTISGDVDTSEPGLYTIDYTISYYGDHGRTQCLVVVQ